MTIFAFINLAHREHNVPEHTKPHQIHQTKAANLAVIGGNENASTSDQCTSLNMSGRKKLHANQKKSEPVTSSPNLSPSYLQNKQYRTNTPRNTDLIDNSVNLNDNKENLPEYGGGAAEHRVDSPKFALQQNSPNTPLSNYKSPPSTHSSPLYTAHDTRTDCNIFTYSPLITEPFKHSTYFHFPDVDTLSPIDHKSTQNLQNDENKSNRKETASVRRARLKSISLDSDGARLCTDSSLPVEEIIERTIPQTTFQDGEDTPPFYSPLPSADEHIRQMVCTTKNINRLVLDLSIKDDTLHSAHENAVATASMEANLPTPKTPTLMQTRQKAFSLDSDQDQAMTVASEFNQNTLNVTSAGHMSKAKPHLVANFLCIESNASASVPTTPKRQSTGKCTKNIMRCGKVLPLLHDHEAMDSISDAKHLCKAENIDSDGNIMNDIHDQYDDVYALETERGYAGSFETSVDDVDCDIINGSANSLTSQFGTSGANRRANSNLGSNNMGLRSNMRGNGLSLSNYSLSNFQGSHCSLTRSNYNIFGTASASSSSLQMAQKSHSMYGYGAMSSTSGDNAFFGSSTQYHQSQEQQHQQFSGIELNNVNVAR